MKLMRSAMIIALISCAPLGYAGNGNAKVLSELSDFSNCRVFQKIIDLTRVAKAVEPELVAPTQDFSFDDSKYSSSTDLSLDSLPQERTPKCVSDLYCSAESNLSMRSAQDFSAVDERCKQPWSVESSVIFSHLRESLVSTESRAEWCEEDCMSLLELLPDLAYCFNPRKSLEVYESVSLAELLAEMKV